MQVVLLQEGADLDALSSAYGLTLLNKRLKIVLPNSLNSSVLQAIEEFKNRFKDKVIKKQQLEWNKVKRVYLTDSHHTPENYDGEIIVYDHHEITQKNKKNIKLHIDNTGSATTIVVEKIKKRNIKLSTEDATILALGIYEDTGNFKFPSTTKKDIKALEYLLNFGIDFNRLRKILEDRFDREDIYVLDSLLKNINTFEINGKQIGITYFNDKYSKDLSRLLKYIKDFENLNAFFAVIGQKNKVSIIGRSKDEDVDVALILSLFGGGGHWYAASAKVKGFSVKEIYDILKFTISEKKLKVEDLLEKKIPVLKSDDSVSRFRELPHFPLYIVVDSQGKYQGVIYDKTLKDLIKHGFENEIVSDYIQDVITLTSSMYIFQLLRLLKTTDQEIFPVVDGGLFLGIITRDILLKKLFHEETKIQLETKPKKRNINFLINKSFPKEILDELRFIGEISKDLGFRTFLVGGVVRDIVMGKQNLDIDLLVEGDATILLTEYAKKKGYSYFFYKEFLTGYIKTDSGLKIDFATARREIYDYPGAYPRIEKATVEEDLIRRDFTINTLIVEITAGNFGTLFDYFGGLRDIKEKRIRILHPVSFIEDPIRILRAIRFAGRFDFKLQKDTEILLKKAVKNDLLNYAPPGRIKLELELIVNEEKILQILRLMETYGILYSLFEIEKLSSEIVSKIQKVKDMMVIFKEIFSFEPSKTFIYLITLISVKPLEEAYMILKNYHFDKEARYLETIYKYVSILKENGHISSYINLLKENKEIILATVILSEDEISDKIIDIYKKYTNPLITGKDLIELGLKPSSEFKKILEDINYRYLIGEFEKKEDCIKYIKENYIGRIKDEDIVG